MTDDLSDVVHRMAEAGKRFGGDVLGIGGLVGPFRRAAEERIELEHAAMRLLAVTHPGDREAVHDEVGHRTKLMGQLRAFQSVYDDVVSGRWPR